VEVTLNHKQPIIIEEEHVLTQQENQFKGKMAMLNV
jgi:hypothetical protein